VDYIGGLIRYKVAIDNESPAIITNVEVQLRMAAQHIRIVSIHPDIYRKGASALIPSMNPHQSQSIDFYLEPLICGVIPVHPAVLFTDATGGDQMVTRDPVDINSKCPLIFNPGETNMAMVKNLFESEKIIKNFISFKLDYPADDVFRIFMSAVQKWAEKPVSDPLVTQDKPLVEEVYYYVMSQQPNAAIGHQETIIIRILVEEEKQAVLVSVGAEANNTVTGVLIHLRGMISPELIHHFGAQLQSIQCPLCGAPIENYNAETGILKCSYCKNTLQLYLGS
jgi:hypothetical protein